MINFEPIIKKETKREKTLKELYKEKIQFQRGLERVNFLIKNIDWQLEDEEIQKIVKEGKSEGLSPMEIFLTK